MDLHEELIIKEEEFITDECDDESVKTEIQFKEELEDIKVEPPDTEQNVYMFGESENTIPTILQYPIDFENTVEAKPIVPINVVDNQNTSYVSRSHETKKQYKVVKFTEYKPSGQHVNSSNCTQVLTKYVSVPVSSKGARIALAPSGEPNSRAPTLYINDAVPESTKPDLPKKKTIATQNKPQIINLGSTLQPVTLQVENGFITPINVLNQNIQILQLPNQITIPLTPEASQSIIKQALQNANPSNLTEWNENIQYLIGTDLQQEVVLSDILTDGSAQLNTKFKLVHIGNAALAGDIPVPYLRPLPKRPKKTETICQQNATTNEKIYSSFTKTPTDGKANTNLKILQNDIKKTETLPHRYKYKGKYYFTKNAPTVSKGITNSKANNYIRKIHEDLPQKKCAPINMVKVNCADCDRKITLVFSFKTLTAHYSMDHAILNERHCKICAHTFKDINSHMKAHAQHCMTKNLFEYKNICKDCKVQHPSECIDLFLLKTQPETQSQSCQRCLKRLYTKDVLSKAQKGDLIFPIQNHRVGKRFENTERRTCKFCSTHTIIKNFQELKMHLLSEHYEITTKLCSICSMSLKDPASHMIIHALECERNTLDCPYCFKYYGNAEQFKVHTLQHVTAFEDNNTIEGKTNELNTKKGTEPNRETETTKIGTTEKAVINKITKLGKFEIFVSKIR